MRGLTHPLPLTPEDEAAFKRAFKPMRETKPLPKDHGVGRFKLGDVVTWSGSKHKHTGTVVEVVPIGEYPTITQAPDVFPTVTFPELNAARYYREHESYVVEVAGKGRGKRYWPRVGVLR